VTLALEQGVERLGILSRHIISRSFLVMRLVSKKIAFRMTSRMRDHDRCGLRNEELEDKYQEAPSCTNSSTCTLHSILALKSTS
jgi:hypothetical protein